jgi:CrcB protein
MVTVSLVGIGASFGAILRYEMTKYIKKRVPSYFPFGTLIINVLACLILGMFATLTLETGNLYALGGVGFCGGLSTFSTLSFETIILIQERRYRIAVEYVLGSLIVGITAISFGAFIFNI